MENSKGTFDVEQVLKTINLPQNLNDAADCLSPIYNIARLRIINNSLRKSMEPFNPGYFFAYRLSFCIQTMVRGFFNIDSDFADTNVFPYVKENPSRSICDLNLYRDQFNGFHVIVYAVNSRTGTALPEVTLYSIRDHSIQVESFFGNVLRRNDSNTPSQLFWTQYSVYERRGIKKMDIRTSNTVPSPPFNLPLQYDNEMEAAAYLSHTFTHGTTAWTEKERRDFLLGMNLRFKLGIKVTNRIQILEPFNHVLDEEAKALFLERMKYEPLPTKRFIRNDPQSLHDWVIWLRVVSENATRQAMGIQEMVKISDYDMMFLKALDIFNSS